MASLFSFVSFMWNTFRPTPVKKSSDALRFGILGAASIAPMALILPAITHPEVFIAAIAARDETKAKAYAKKHKIPIVHKSYQDVLDDPSIDVVYIPLPNGLHYEWAVKALKAGKHILLEKPATSNAIEASKLFNHPLFKQPNAPVILEAFHYRFHPAWQAFLSKLDPSSIVKATSEQWLLKGFIPTNDIRFNYSLAGGTLMDFGTYNISELRQVFAAEPTACVSASYRPMPPGYDKDIDQAIYATWKFPNGGTGSMEADLAATGGWPFPWLTKSWPSMALPRIVVEHEATPVAGEEEHTVQRVVTMWLPIAPQLYHRIDVEDKHVVRRADGSVSKAWSETEKIKTYSTHGRPDWWSTYRYQLEEFVNRVKGREGSGVWVSAEDSVRQMEMIDSAYKESGLPLRQTSTYEG